MPVKVVVHGLETTKDVLAKYQKKLGESIGSFGGKYLDTDRVPTGLFPFDLATGGGFPRGMCSIVYGPESSNKTNKVLRAIAMNQKLRPKETNVFIAIEPFDPAWAKKIGVDVDKLAVMYPSYAEQVVDISLDFLNAEDCGIVAIDSLAAMITTAEAEKSAESANPGGQGLVVGKLVRKTTLALNEARKHDRNPTLVYINQTRYKIGVMYGDPETMPGGNAPRFQSALWVRVYGKNIIDSKVSDTHPVRKEVNFVIKKNKVPIIASSGKYEMVTWPHDGLGVGEVNDWNTVTEYLKNFDALEKVKGGYLILDENYPTLQAFRDRLTLDKEFGADVRQAIIGRVLSENDAIIQENPAIDADGVITEEEAA